MHIYQFKMHKKIRYIWLVIVENEQKEWSYSGDINSQLGRQHYSQNKKVKEILWQLKLQFITIYWKYNTTKLKLVEIVANKFRNL